MSFTVLGLELLSQLLEVVSGQLGVERDAAGFLHLVDELLEVLLADFHDDVGVHLDEAAIGVVCEAGIVGLVCEGHDDLVIEAEVEDGVHHARHGGTRAGTDGDEQRVVQVAELLAGHFFQLLDVLHDLGLDVGVDLMVVLVVLRAGLGGDGEALRDRHAKAGHFCQVCALAAEQLTHLAVALGEQVYILVRHLCETPFLTVVKTSFVLSQNDFFFF